MTIITKQQLREFLDGACDAEEESMIRRYLETPEGMLALNKLMDEAWLTEEESLPDESKTFSSILSKTTRSPQRKVQSSLFYKIAALFIILAIPTYLLLQQPPQPPTQPQVDVLVKKNERGQKSVIHLSDGSKVYLNSESSIKYNRYFTDSSRIIELDGEAYFEVAKDKKRPFIVYSQGYETTALGTEFNVNSRASHYKISLAEGRIMVNAQHKKSNSINLAPGEAVKIDTEGHILKKETGNAQDFLWISGILDFHNASIQEIITSLERWYDVKITLISKPKTSKRYTGRFDNASLEHVLTSMSFALDFKYQIHDKKINLTF
ncbi:FecR family protein [Fulvivirga sediminis]|uniref:FecR domain-containing protein n=1 Tax=Fulvivirga sediminis TaxID=2803949 RepID=A0A937F6U5_9BACT|nr:FecR domain-containing protein [Fulvivirga sediminis]MBL3657512.1 FecR domain-containing protein [Fulvivirga sediminis]